MNPRAQGKPFTSIKGGVPFIKSEIQAAKIRGTILMGT